MVGCVWEASGKARSTAENRRRSSRRVKDGGLKGGVEGGGRRGGQVARDSPEMRAKKPALLSIVDSCFLGLFWVYFWLCFRVGDCPHTFQALRRGQARKLEMCAGFFWLPIRLCLSPTALETATAQPRLLLNGATRRGKARVAQRWLQPSKPRLLMRRDSTGSQQAQMRRESGKLRRAGGHAGPRNGRT